MAGGAGAPAEASSGERTGGAPVPAPGAGPGGARPWHRDLARLASAAVLAQLLPLLVLPWLTRRLPADEIGRWTLLATLAANFAVVACLRFEYALVLPRSRHSARALLGLCLALAVGWGGLLALVLGLWTLLGAGRLAALAPYEALGAVLVWLPPAVTLAGLIQALTLWHNRAGRYADISRARMANPLTAAGLQAGGAGLAGASWLGQSGAHLLCGGQLLGQAVGAAWLGWRARAERPWQAVLALLRAGAWRARARAWILVRRHRQFPLVNTPHAFINGLQDTLALALVLASAGPAAAGFFGLMVRVVMAPTSLIGGALSELLLGRAAQTWREGGDLRPILRRALRLLTLFALPSALVLALAGPALFAAVFGDHWREAGEWARWLAPCMAGRMIVGPLTVLPMILGRQPTALAFSLCGNALYVGALGLGLALGGLAAACAAVSLVMSAYFLSFGLWLWRTAARAHAQTSRPQPQSTPPAAAQEETSP